MKAIIGIVFVLGIVGLAAHVASASHAEAVWQAGDEEILLSDMPLTGLQAMNEGEHSANDFGPVLIIVVETCNGVAI